MAFFHRAAPAVAALALACGNAGPVRIGVAGAFTDAVGHPMLLGARLAVAELNAQGGIHGRKIELIEANDYGNADSAVLVATRLYQSDAVAVVGHLYSGTTIAAAPVYNGGTDPIVAISPSSSSPALTGIGPYTFRVCPSDDQHGAALAQWARERLGLSRGTVFYLNDDYGRGVRQRFVAEFVRRGGEIIHVNPYLGGTPDVSVYLDRMVKEGRSQFMIDAGNLSEAEEILRQARGRGITLPLLGADGLEGIETAGPLAEGVYETLGYLWLLKTPANEAFVATYRARYPDQPPPNQPAAATYDAIKLLAQVIGRVGTDRKAIRGGLLAVNTAHPYQGVTGQIAFDSLGDVPSRQVYVAVVRNGALELADGQ